MSQLLTPIQISDYLRLSLKTIYNMVSEGRLPCYRVNKRCVRFNKEQIDEWLAQKQQEGRTKRIPELDKVIANK